MVLLIRSLGRLALRPTSRSLCTAGAARRPSIISTRAAPLRPNIFGSIRTLTEKREKVKVLLVLYDGKKHAVEVSADLFAPAAQAPGPLSYLPRWVDWVHFAHNDKQ
jgi:hypothetical protein